MTQIRTRREFLTNIGTASAVILVPATISPTTSGSSVWPWSAPDDAVSHSGDRLSWIVSVDTDDDDDEDGSSKLESLESWTERTENDRRVIERTKHEASGTATVIATPADIGVRARDNQYLSDGLAFESWVDSVELNRTVQLAEPISPESEDVWDEMSPGRLMSAHMSAFGGDLNASGVAFDADMESGPLYDTRTATDAIGIDTDTSTLRVAVVDSGINDGSVFDTDGEEAGTRILESSWNVITDETGIDAIQDDDGHGTWVASCITANDAEVNYRGYLTQSEVLGVKALSDGGGAIDEIAAAIRYAADQGADLICLSLGSPLYSMAIADALEYAVGEGAIPVAAAGNDRQATRWLATPASIEHTIAVGATTTAPPEEAQSAYYSNTAPHNGFTDDSGGITAGAQIDVGAPGCKITARTPTLSGGSTLTELTGTSMAAPVTCGVIGHYLAENPDADLEEVREMLEKTCEPVQNAAVEEVGYGMPNAANLLSGDEPEETQEEAMTDDAAARGLAYRQLSQSRTAKMVVEINEFVDELI
ncbi:S8 family peptidase [Natronorubrum sp. DTA7]|uniref:S8 family peptidase n=1 Tax=Natronorubrum sp. DTA7 TaxID=3447016 RepID=UPI003F867BD6